MDTNYGRPTLQRRSVCGRRRRNGSLQRIRNRVLRGRLSRSYGDRTGLAADSLCVTARPGASLTGSQLKKEYVPDFICFGKIIVELKAIDQLTCNQEAQILNYLKATGLRVGVLINFGNPKKLEWKRFVK